MKRNLRISLIILILLGIILIGGILLYFNNNSTNNLINSIQENIPFLENSENDNPSSGINSGISGGSSGGGSGSTGGAGSSGGTTTNQNCQNVQITYSLGTLPVSEICNTYQGEICTDKQVICYVDVRNLDIVDGNFNIAFIFHERANVGNVFASNNESIFVSSNDNELLSSSKLFTGTEANQNISCATATNSVPVKQICS